jgi:hypothetical protein
MWEYGFCDDEFIGADEVVEPLVKALTGLRKLQLVQQEPEDLPSAVLLPIVATLTSLTDLGLSFGELMLLSGLTQLTRLVLREHHSSAEGQEAFLAGMPHLAAIGSSYLDSDNCD